MPNNLADRAEAGEALRPLILALNDAMIPTMSDEHADAFVRFLDINTPEAHLAAAMMLVPEGWSIGLGDLRGYDPPIWRAHLRDHRPDSLSPEGRSVIWVEGNTSATPAHALIAAIARSQADGR